MRTTARGVYRLLVVSRYLLIGPDGKVLKVDKMQWSGGRAFAIRLPESLPPGRYTVSSASSWTAMHYSRRPGSCISVSARRAPAARMLRVARRAYGMVPRPAGLVPNRRFLARQVVRSQLV